MDGVNPASFEPLKNMLEVVARRFEERGGLDGYASPAPESFGRYRTFCET